MLFIMCTCPSLFSRSRTPSLCLLFAMGWALAVSADQSIYTDGLGIGWNDWSWATVDTGLRYLVG